MPSIKAFTKVIAILLVAAISAVQVAAPVAHARMIGTDSCLESDLQATGRERIKHFLNREDVRDILSSQGVSPGEAQARVAALTDAEVLEISRRIEQMPAGGGTFGIIVGASLIVFLVLLVTDILGYTEIFPFVKRI
jgi:hypothetical protein